MDPRHLALSASIKHRPGGVEKRITTIRRHVPLRGGALLEIGCGDAVYARALRADFARVVGVDIRMDELPRDLPAAQMSADRLAFADGTFDCVLAVEVLEHIDSTERVFRELARVLRPGGLFCFTSPNRWFPLETHHVQIAGRTVSGKRVPLLPYVPPLHRRWATARNFTASGLRRALGRAGFREVATGFIMPPFDRWPAGRRYVKPVTDALERTPLRVLGVSVVGVYERAS